MKRIKLTQGRFALVDGEDYEKLSAHKWRVAKIGHHFRPIRLSKDKDNGKRPTIYMYREIMNAQKGIQVDHINHDCLDNRKSNLRLCTHGENLKNLRIGKSNICGYKGVILSHNKVKMWRAVLHCDGKYHFGGSYTTKEEAALAYNKLAIKYHGEFAFLNKVPPLSNTKRE